MKRLPQINQNIVEYEFKKIHDKIEKSQTFDSSPFIGHNFT